MNDDEFHLYSLDDPVTPLNQGQRPLFAHYPPMTGSDHVETETISQRMTPLDSLHKSSAAHHKRNVETMKSFVNKPQIERQVTKVEVGVQVRQKQLLQAQGIEDQGIINMIKNHLIDVVCRISSYQRDKMKMLMFSEEMCGDDCQPALLEYTIKGI